MTRKNNRGFTLVELIVSLTAGLVVSAAAFLMARNATNFFQHEAGITSAQYSVMVGFARLQADLKNAAYLSSPNLPLEEGNQQFCGAVSTLPAGGMPHATMQDMAGVHLVQDGSYNVAPAGVRGLWDLNGGMKPDSITITGSFDTTEQFSAAAVSPPGAGAKTIVLNEVNDGATIRTRLAANRGGATFSAIFRPGRILRVRDREGRFALGVIDTVVDSGTQVTITTLANPDLGKREVNRTCGCSGFCIGAPINVIARMHYSVRAIPTGGNWANLFVTADLSDPARVAAYHRGSPTQASRTELTRVELLPNGSEDATTLQVLAEHAVDLEFGATYETTAAPANPPNTTREEVGGPAGNRYAIGGLPSAGGRPDLMRSLQVRLSTRAHRRDRDVGLNPLNDGTQLRFNLGANLGFARMRTLVADIALPNQSRRLAP